MLADTFQIDIQQYHRRYRMNFFGRLLVYHFLGCMRPFVTLLE